MIVITPNNIFLKIIDHHLNHHQNDHRKWLGSNSLIWSLSQHAPWPESASGALDAERAQTGAYIVTGTAQIQRRGIAMCQSQVYNHMEGLSCQDSIAALSLFMSAEGQCPLTLPVAAVAVAQGDRGGLITEASCIFVCLLLDIARQYSFHHSIALCCFNKGLASYCKAKTTFTFHSCILTLSNALLIEALITEKWKVKVVLA